jgi:Uma2 family endonuclease
MSTITTTTIYTPEDLLRMPDGDRYELIDGQFVEQTTSWWSCFVAGQLFSHLADYCKANRLGWTLLQGTTYQCFPDAPANVRRADVSFIKGERLSLTQAKAAGHVTIAPDLAVEVLSPNDLAYEVDQKLQEYLSAGVRLVWIVHPQTQTVDVHRIQGTSTILHENDDLDGEDVVPGFRCRVGDLFIPPPGVQANP